ncbi:MAG: ATP-binding protein [Oscillospiraceae bacterium]
MRQRMQSIYFKNFMTIVLLLCMSFLILGAAFAGLSYRFIISEKRQTMQQNAETVGKMISANSQVWSVDGLEMKAVMLFISEITGFDIIVTDEEGTVIACSDPVKVCPHIGTAVPARVIAEVNQRDSFSGFTSLDGVYEQELYVVGVMLPESGRVKDGDGGYIFLSGNAEQMSEIWRHFSGIFLMAALVVVLIAFVLTLITTRKQTRPIKEMADAAHRFGTGDFAARVDPGDRDDEIGELAEAFNAMADSLERSEKSRRDLIANVSHELKTPMTTITGFADGILDGTIPPEKERDYLEVISSETKRLSRLVRGMLDMSQLQDMDTGRISAKSFDISEVICQALLSLEQKITKRSLDVDAKLPEEPIMAIGDRDSITQVVYNLIDNAAKFATEGTAIGLSLWKEEGKVYVSVENHGETIPKDELPLIFERFHKTDRSRSVDREGVGLGLYIVKTILDSHGEDIFVTSRDGITKFVFTLKLAKNTGSQKIN